MMLNCTFLANCGLYLETETEGLLVDAPNGLHSPFDGVSEAEGLRMISGEPPYDKLIGMLFTHKHSDHFDRKRARAVQENKPSCLLFAPGGDTPEQGELQAGCAHIHYFTVPHSGLEFTNTVHRVFVIEMAGKTVYVTGDADWQSDLHKEILSTYRPDVCFFNPNYVSHDAGREVLKHTKKSFIYHMPFRSEDTYGIARKCRSSFDRYGSELVNAELIERYPITVEL